MHTHTHMCARTQTYTHTHTHAYRQIPSNKHTDPHNSKQVDLRRRFRLVAATWITVDWNVGSKQRFELPTPQEENERTRCLMREGRERQTKGSRREQAAALLTMSPPRTFRHWFIILISLISTAAAIFQMSFSNLCQTVWPFLLIQLMTGSAARRICNSDWALHRPSSRIGGGVCVYLYQWLFNT